MVEINHHILMILGGMTNLNVFKFIFILKILYFLVIDLSLLDCSK
jgi:hypothetical protein